MRGAVTAELDPARAAAWAHSQDDATGGGGTSRLLCTRALRPGARCLAAVVPLHDADGRARWTPGRHVRGLPVLHHFRFTTNEAGTFEDLVVQLHPVPPPDGLGRVTLHANPPGGDALVAPTTGALAPYDAPPRSPLADPTVPARLEALLEPPPIPAVGAPLPPPDDGAPIPPHPVLGAPRWSAPFRSDATAPWVGEVDLDPRYRAAAGLGARAAVDWQERIATAAAARLGGTHRAAALLRHLTAGVALARRAATRQPADPAARLAFLGPALPNVQVPGPGGPVDATTHLCPPDRPVPAALLSAAAGHLLRPSGATAKATDEPDVVGDPGAVLYAALRCPPEPPSSIDPHDLPTDPVDLERALAALQDAGERLDPEDLSRALADAPPDDEPEGSGSCHERDPGWIDAVVGRLDDAFRPDGVPVDRVVGRIGGLHESWDVPLEVRPDLDLPVWDWLWVHEPDWLLPQAGLIPPNGVVALRSDRAFVAAALLGASRQAVRELRWRGVPVASGAMPMRTFWQHVAGPDNPPPMVDLVQPQSWPSLGLADLPGPRGPGDELVIALRSDLVLRYPDTRVFLAPAVRIAGRGAFPDLDDPVPPSFAGRIAPDVWFFGFPIRPAALGDHVVVLEEPDRGPRFRPPDGQTAAGYHLTTQEYRPDGSVVQVPHSGLADGGAYAAAAYVQPVLAFIDGRDLMGPA
jgi:hypothetical protein